MGKVLSDDKRDPHRYDPSPRGLSSAQARGWRTRAEVEREPFTPMTKAELEIERLAGELDRATNERGPFGDPLENAMGRIKELLSMFNCQSCYDKGWVVGIEGASSADGMGGSNEVQVACPDCSPIDRAAKPRAIDGELGERVSEMRRLYMIVNEAGTEKLTSWDQARRMLEGLCIYLAPDLADELEQTKPRPMDEAPLVLEKLRPMDEGWPGNGTKFLMCYRVFEIDGTLENADRKYDIVGWLPDRPDAATSTPHDEGETDA